MLYELCGNGFYALYRHVKDQRLVWLRQAAPVQLVNVRRAGGFFLRGKMTWKENARAGVVAVGEGYARHCSAALRGSDAGNDFAGDVVLLQALYFFAASAKDAGVASFEAYHVPTRLRLLNQQGVDFSLSQVVFSGGFSGIKTLGGCRYELQYRRVYQAVVYDDIRLLNTGIGTQGEQVGCTRSGTDNADHAAGGTGGDKVFRDVHGQCAAVFSGFYGTM